MNFIEQRGNFLHFVHNDKVVPVGGNFLTEKRRVQQKRSLQIALQKIQISRVAELLLQ